MTWVEIYLSVITLICLSINAYNDQKTRYASLRVWIFQIISSLLGIVIYQVTEGFSFIVLIGITINIVLAFLLFALTLYTGLWGGGDAMGILALGFSVPFIFSFIPIPPKFSFFPPMIFLITNLILGIALYTLYFLIFNLIDYIRTKDLFSETSGSLLIKISTLITSRKLPVEEIHEKMFYDPTEEYTEGGWRLQHSFLMPDLDDDELEELERRTRLESKVRAEETGRTYLWHRYQVPGIVPFLIGFVFWLVFGSPLVWYLELIA